MLSDPLGIITSAYFFVCKIGIIVRWIYICELIATKFPCQKYNVPMDEVPILYLPFRPTVLLNHIAQTVLSANHGPENMLSKKPHKGLDFLIYKGLLADRQSDTLEPVLH